MSDTEKKKKKGNKQWAGRNRARRSMIKKSGKARKTTVLDKVRRWQRGLVRVTPYSLACALTPSLKTNWHQQHENSSLFAYFYTHAAYNYA